MKKHLVYSLRTLLVSRIFSRRAIAELVTFLICSARVQQAHRAIVSTFFAPASHDVANINEC